MTAIAQVKTTSKQQTAPATPVSRRQRYEIAGRAFKAAYDALPKGDRASLRHDHVDLQKSFWTCLGASRKAAGLQLSTPELETVFTHAIPLFALKHLQGANPKHGKNLGELLQHPDLTARRVESVMSESNLATLCEQVESVSTIAKLQLDYGVLIADLIEFDHDSGSIRRKWARSLYLNFTSVDLSAARRATN